MKKFLLEIVTPQRQAFSDQVDMVVVPSNAGVLGVMAHHEPLFASLADGEITIKMAGKEYYLAIGGGFMEVTRDKVVILVSRAVHADELNEAEIKKAQAAAREVIANKVQGAELLAAQAMLRRSMVDLKVFRHRKPRTTIS
jgi:F-type H+-transporting ATPase subunit epsilon